MEHSELGPQLDTGQKQQAVIYREPSVASQCRAWEREQILARLWIDALSRAAKGEQSTLTWDGRTYQVSANPAALKAWRAIDARLTVLLTAK